MLQVAWALQHSTVVRVITMSVFAPWVIYPDGWEGWWKCPEWYDYSDGPNKVNTLEPSPFLNAATSTCLFHSLPAASVQNSIVQMIGSLVLGREDVYLLIFLQEDAHTIVKKAHKPLIWLVDFASLCPYGCIPGDSLPVSSGTNCAILLWSCRQFLDREIQRAL